MLLTVVFCRKGPIAIVHLLAGNKGNRAAERVHLEAALKSVQSSETAGMVELKSNITVAMSTRMKLPFDQTY